MIFWSDIHNQRGYLYSKHYSYVVFVFGKHFQVCLCHPLKRCLLVMLFEFLRPFDEPLTQSSAFNRRIKIKILGWHWFARIQLLFIQDFTRSYKVAIFSDPPTYLRIPLCCRLWLLFPLSRLLWLLLIFRNPMLHHRLNGQRKIFREFFFFYALFRWGDILVVCWR